MAIRMQCIYECLLEEGASLQGDVLAKVELVGVRRPLGCLHPRAPRCLVFFLGTGPRTSSVRFAIRETKSGRLRLSEHQPDVVLLVLQVPVVLFLLDETFLHQE